MEWTVSTTTGAIMEMDGTSAQLECAMGWRKEDPAVVYLKLSFYTHDNHVCGPLSGCGESWQVGRILLVDACVYGKKAGEFDIIVHPDNNGVFGPVVMLHLGNETEHAHLILSRQSLYRFLGETLSWTALWDENYAPQVDALIEKLRVW